MHHFVTVIYMYISERLISVRNARIFLEIVALSTR